MALKRYRKSENNVLTPKQDLLTQRLDRLGKMEDKKFIKLNVP